MNGSTQSLLFWCWS